MKKGTTFERKGRTYEILQEGAEYIADNKVMCIKAKGETRGIRLDVALETGIVGTVDRVAAVDTEDPAGPLFTQAKKKPAKVQETPLEGTDEKKGTSVVPVAPAAVRGHYYIPVSAVRAQLGLAQGIICPAGFQDDDSTALGRDVVAATPGVLPLYIHPPKLDTDQVLLHVLLTDDEAADSRRVGDTLLFKYPLPVSRIMRIGLPRSVGDVSKYLAGWIEPDVPVPVHLCATEANNSSPALPPTSPEMEKNRQPSTEVREMLRRYNRYLGLFAYLRNAARYNSRSAGAYADYPAHYFQLIRQLFADHPALPAKSLPTASPAMLALLDLDVDIGESTRQLVALTAGEAPYVEKNTARKLALSMYEANGKDQILQQAFKALFEDDFREAARILSNAATPPEASMLAALFAFSDRQSNDHRNMKQTLHSDWANTETIAHVTAILGAYYGYRILDALETRLYSVDPFIAELVDPKPPVKFHLASVYERQLIEAVYQWAFYRRKLDAKTAHMFSGAETCPEKHAARVSGVLVRSKNTYQVGDLNVRAYELTPIARCLRRLLECPGESVDEKSELGNYLMLRCFFHADEYELSRKAGRELIRYSIRKSKIVDLIKEEKLRPSVRVMNAALDADTSDEE